MASTFRLSTSSFKMFSLREYKKSSELFERRCNLLFRHFCNCSSCIRFACKKQHERTFLCELIPTFDGLIRCSFSLLYYCSVSTVTFAANRNTSLLLALPEYASGTMPRCRTTLEQVTRRLSENSSLIATVDIPQCDVNGLFVAKQCGTVSRACRCVVKETGQTIPGTSRPPLQGADLNCSGELPCDPFI